MNTKLDEDMRNKIKSYNLPIEPSTGLFGLTAFNTTRVLNSLREEKIKNCSVYNNNQYFFDINNFHSTAYPSIFEPYLNHQCSLNLCKSFIMPNLDFLSSCARHNYFLFLFYHFHKQPDFNGTFDKSCDDNGYYHMNQVKNNYELEGRSMLHNTLARGILN